MLGIWSVLFVPVSIVHNLVTMQGVLHCCICCFLHIVIDHLRLCIHCCVACLLDGVISMLYIWFILFIIVSVVYNLVMMQGILHCCICCFLHIVVDHLTLRILPLVANVGIVIHTPFVKSRQDITYCIDTICMLSHQVLLGLLHHKMRFCNLGVEFLDQ
jgi:hypothetical protein